MDKRGCKYLDYEKTKYPSCRLVEKDGYKWWERDAPYEGAPTRIQFCGQGRGRINGIFQCINPGEMGCFEPHDKEK